MKALFLSIGIVFLLSGCSIRYMQYYRTETVNTRKTDSSYVYENDSLRITYTFWANGGIMSFNIFNKMDKPLYIDWKRSSFIINSNNVYYYDDTILSRSYTHVYYTNYYNWWNGLTTRPTSASSVTTHQIATTFLPPKTQMKQSLPYIVNKNLNDWAGYETRYQVRNDSRKKQTRISDKHFSKDNSPVVFRNFLTLSDRQDFQNTFSIDNGFYISDMQAMDVRNFMKQRSDNSWEFFYRNGTDFFLYR